MDLTSPRTGKAIFESVPSALQPRWAGFVLSQFNYYLSTVPAQVNNLFTIIKNPEMWKQAHEQFTQIRKLLLSGASFDFDPYLYLAELVAKVTYNASGQPAPFDEDTGWNIPNIAMQAADCFNHERLRPDVESTLLLFYNNAQLKDNLQAATDYILYKQIDDLLWFEWDPIKVNNLAPRDEYQSYLPKVYELKKGKMSKEAIASYLLSIERNQMSMDGNRNECLRIAKLITEL